jgi:hypothetical protein
MCPPPATAPAPASTPKAAGPSACSLSCAYASGTVLYQLVSFVLTAISVARLPASYLGFSSWNRYELFYLRMWNSGFFACLAATGAAIGKGKATPIYTLWVGALGALVLPSLITHIFPMFFFFPLGLLLFFIVCILVRFVQSKLTCFDACCDRGEANPENAKSDEQVLAEANRRGEIKNPLDGVIAVICASIRRNIQWDNTMVLAATIYFTTIFYHGEILYTAGVSQQGVVSGGYFGLTKEWNILTDTTCFFKSFEQTAIGVFIDENAAGRKLMTALSYFLV